MIAQLLHCMLTHCVCFWGVQLKSAEELVHYFATKNGGQACRPAQTDRRLSVLTDAEEASAPGAAPTAAAAPTAVDEAARPRAPRADAGAAVHVAATAPAAAAAAVGRRGKAAAPAPAAAAAPDLAPAAATGRRAKAAAAKPAGARKAAPVPATAAAGRRRRATTTLTMKGAPRQNVFYRRMPDAEVSHRTRRGLWVHVNRVAIVSMSAGDVSDASQMSQYIEPNIVSACIAAVHYLFVCRSSCFARPSCCTRQAHGVKSQMHSGGESSRTR